MARFIVVAGLVATLSLFGLAGAASASPSIVTVRVDGHFRIVSTDCYFARGSCTATFDIEDAAGTLSSPTDRYFHGHVNGDRISFGEIWPPGVSEDGWWCHGATVNGGLTFKGTMMDGIGETGTYVLRRIGS